MFPRFRIVASWMFLGIACTAVTIAQSVWKPSPQGIGFGQPRGAQWVRMVSSPTLVLDAAAQAGKRNDRELRFVIQSGLHINSHTPHSRFLIPTTLTLDTTPGVHIVSVEYPKGVDYRFQFAPRDALNVYTGDFGVLLRLGARPGNYTVHGSLHYQACDDRACNPPQTLPILLNITAK